MEPNDERKKYDEYNFPRSFPLHFPSEFKFRQRIEKEEKKEKKSKVKASVLLRSKHTKVLFSHPFHLLTRYQRKFKSKTRPHSVHVPFTFLFLLHFVFFSFFFVLLLLFLSFFLLFPSSSSSFLSPNRFPLRVKKKI